MCISVRHIVGRVRETGRSCRGVLVSGRGIPPENRHGSMREADDLFARVVRPDSGPQLFGGEHRVTHLGLFFCDTRKIPCQIWRISFAYVGGPDKEGAAFGGSP